VNVTTVTDLDLKAGDEVLLRLDLNVPMENGKVTDDTRIRATLPTIEYLREKRCKIIAMSHLGRPKRKDPALSLEPAAARLAEIVGSEVLFGHEPGGEEMELVVRELQPGGILVLENLRFDPGETAPDPNFAAGLARLARTYVNDAFGTMHRKDASIALVPGLVERAAVGLLVKREIEALDRLLDAPEKPFVAVLGGAKVSDKIGVIENLSRRCDAILIGGAMAYTFLKAKGKAVGDSLVEDDKLLLAERLLERCAERGTRVLLPVDHVVAKNPDDSSDVKVVPSIEAGWKGLDIGPATVSAFTQAILDARSVFWNGPMGVFEKDAFSGGTRGVGEALAATEGYTVVGGGDSAAAIAKFHLDQRIDYISTGGGASLTYMEGAELVGLKAIRARGN
jgi:phosphoglycerate kinase